MAGQRRETSLYEFESPGSLPGLGRGTTRDFFQIAGIWLADIDRLKSLVRNINPFGPRCFKCRFDISSGPMALDDLAFLMASSVAWGVKVVGFESGNQWAVLVTSLVCFFNTCLTIDVYWKLNLFAISWAEETNLPLNLYLCFLWVWVVH